MQPGLFRPKALSRISSPEQLDQLMRVTSARSWLAFFGLGAVIVGAIVWGFVGSLPTTVTGQAVLIHQGRQSVVATAAGLVVSIKVSPEQEVAQGQVIAYVQSLSQTASSGAPPANGQIPIVSPARGQIDQILVEPGNLVALGDPVATIEGFNAKLEAYTYVPIALGKQIKPGMTVQVSPSSVSRAQYGYLIGHVQSVGDFPVTQQGLSLLLDNDQLTNQLLSGGPVLQVIVQFVPDPKTVSGFKWSSPKGPPYQLTHGTLASAQVIVSQQRPISLVLPGA